MHLLKYFPSLTVSVIPLHFGGTHIHVIQEPLIEYVTHGEPTNEQTIVAFIAAILLPSAGLGCLIIYISFQPIAQLHLKRFVPHCLARCFDFGDVAAKPMEAPDGEDEKEESKSASFIFNERGSSVAFSAHGSSIPVEEMSEAELVEEVLRREELVTSRSDSICSESSKNPVVNSSAIKLSVMSNLEQ